MKGTLETYEKERTDPISEMREDGKLHILIIQGDRFISIDEEPLEDFEVASVGLMSNAKQWLWKWSQQERQHGGTFT